MHNVFKAIFASTKGYFTSTPIYYAFTYSKDEWNALFDRHMSAAKVASDFVGIIMRMAFCLFCSMFLYNEYKKTIDKIAVAGSAWTYSLLFDEYSFMFGAATSFVM
jgi:hypothetical protein